MPDTPAPPKPRRFWQIHLSTAIVMMLAIGGMRFIMLTLTSAPF